MMLRRCSSRRGSAAVLRPFSGAAVVATVAVVSLLVMLTWLALVLPVPGVLAQQPCTDDANCTAMPGSFCNMANMTCGCAPLGCDGNPNGRCGPAVDDGCGGTIDCTGTECLGLRAECATAQVAADNNVTEGFCFCQSLSCSELLSTYGICGDELLGGCPGVLVPCPCSPIVSPPPPPPPPVENWFEDTDPVTLTLIIVAVILGVCAITAVGVYFAWKSYRPEDEFAASVAAGRDRSGSVDMSVDDYVSALMEVTDEDASTTTSATGSASD